MTRMTVRLPWSAWMSAVWTTLIHEATVIIPLLFNVLVDFDVVDPNAICASLSSSLHPEVIHLCTCFIIFCMIQDKGIMGVCWNKNSWKFTWCLLYDFPLSWCSQHIHENLENLHDYSHSTMSKENIKVDNFWNSISTYQAVIPLRRVSHDKACIHTSMHSSHLDPRGEKCIARRSVTKIGPGDEIQLYNRKSIKPSTTFYKGKFNFNIWLTFFYCNTHHPVHNSLHQKAGLSPLEDPGGNTQAIPEALIQSRTFHTFQVFLNAKQYDTISESQFLYKKNLWYIFVKY